MTLQPKNRRRRSIRLPGYDYTQPGAYFVTICTHERQHLFGDVVAGQMRLSTAGRVVDWYWRRLPQHFPHVRLDAHMVMPNHAHVILWIVDAVGATHSPTISGQMVNAVLTDGPDQTQRVLGNASPLLANSEKTVNVVPTDGPDQTQRVLGNASSPLRPNGPAPGSVGAIIGNFKSVTTRRINKMNHAPGDPVWQRNFYEHIVRNERALHAIRQYIADNPARWHLDRYNAAAESQDPLAVSIMDMLRAGES